MYIYIYKPQNNETNNDKYLQMTKMFPHKQNIKFSCKKKMSTILRCMSHNNNLGLLGVYNITSIVSNII